MRVHAFRYESSAFELLSQLPVGSLLSPAGLLCLWVTNSASVRDWAERLLLEWGLEEAGALYWLKVSTGKCCICSCRLR